MKVVYTRHRAEKISPTSKNFIYLWSRFANADHQKDFDDFLDVEIDYDPPEEVYQLTFDL
jgi:hypothetical protein